MPSSFSCVACFFVYIKVLVDHGGDVRYFEASLALFGGENFEDFLLSFPVEIKENKLRNKKAKWIDTQIK